MAHETGINQSMPVSIATEQATEHKGVMWLAPPLDTFH